MRRRRPRGGAAFGARAVFVFLWCACLASAAGGDETDSASGTPRSAPTLLVSFDGFRASYLDAQDPSALPELTALWRGGVRAALRPRFISKTFPNHYSLVTGLNEQTHGIVANRFFDPDANASFSPNSDASFWWNGGEPLWVTAVRDGRDARVYFWPGSDVEIQGVRPTEFRAYEKTVSFDARVDAVARWVLDAVHENRTNSKHPFFAVYFEEPDASGHVHGPRAEETKAAVRRVDDALRRLRVAVGDAVWNEINVIVVSDHGMAELEKSRAVFLADDPCGVPFHDLHIEGSDVVMHVWPRTSATRNGSSSFPVDPADPSAAWFDARALAEKVDACHAFVKAWTRESVPKRFAYGENRRVGPVVIAADVGWTLCGANASRDGDKSSFGDASGNNTNASYAHERDWAEEHSGCVASLGAAAGHRGAHGFDNDAPEMRAVFIARGPSFRKDGARLLADTGDGHGKVTAATGRDADETSGIAGADSNRTDLHAVAAAWESKTFVIDNTAVFAIASTALGMDAKSVLADGRPFPIIDGVLDEVVRDALFDAGDEDEDDARRDSGSRRALGIGSAAAFLAAASVSFTAFTLIDRRLTGRWPFERARAVLSEMDAEQTLPEMELVGVAETRRSGADG